MLVVLVEILRILLFFLLKNNRLSDARITRSAMPQPTPISVWAVRDRPTSAGGCSRAVVESALNAVFDGGAAVVVEEAAPSSGRSLLLQMP